MIRRLIAMSPGEPQDVLRLASLDDTSAFRGVRFVMKGGVVTREDQR